MTEENKIEQLPADSTHQLADNYVRYGSTAPQTVRPPGVGTWLKYNYWDGPAPRE